MTIEILLDELISRVLICCLAPRIQQFQIKHQLSYETTRTVSGISSPEPDQLNAASPSLITLIIRKHKPLVVYPNTCSLLGCVETFTRKPDAFLNVCPRTREIR